MYHIHMTFQIWTTEYLQEAMCRWEKENCSCLNALKKHIISDLNQTLNIASRKKLNFKENGSIAFQWCGKADQIIWVTVHNITELMEADNLSPEQVIQNNLKQLIDHVKAFREENNNDPHLQSVDAKRNKHMNRLEISFQRWLSNEQKDEIIRQYNSTNNF